MTILLLLGLSAQAQDWCSWSFQYDFKMKSNARGYRFDGLDVSINDPFQSSRLQRGDLIYNDSTSTYSLILDYGCISCGYGDMKHPPTTYLELYLFDDFLDQDISLIIPLTFDTIKDLETYGRQKPFSGKGMDLSAVYLDFGTISFEDFMLLNSGIDRYEGIRVKPGGEIYKYKSGEYPFPATEKLIKIKQR